MSNSDRYGQFRQTLTPQEAKLAALNASRWREGRKNLEAVFASWWRGDVSEQRYEFSHCEKTRTRTPSFETSPAFMSRSSLATALDCAESTVDELVKRGVLPKPFKLSPGVVRWRWGDVEAAINSLQHENNLTERDPYLIGVQNVVIKKSD